MNSSKKFRRPKSSRSKSNSMRSSKASKAGKPKGGGARKSQMKKSRAASRMSVAGRRKSVAGQKKSMGTTKKSVGRKSMRKSMGTRRESLFASFKGDRNLGEDGIECASAAEDQHLLNSNRLIIALAVLAVAILFAWLHSTIMFDRYKRMKRIH